MYFHGAYYVNCSIRNLKCHFFHVLALLFLQLMGRAVNFLFPFFALFFSLFLSLFRSFQFSFLFLSFMEKRKAYNLKWLLAVYNLAQVMICCHLIFGMLSNEFNIIKFWKCQSVDYENTQKANTLLTFAYKTFLLKLLELVETVFFVLRKKQNQVSKLHVYHHVSTAMLAWILVKYIAG